MLKIFKITSYAIILFLFSSTALDAADLVPDCPSDEELNAEVYVGVIPNGETCGRSEGCSERYDMPILTLNQCQNHNATRAFRRIKKHQELYNEDFPSPAPSSLYEEWYEMDYYTTATGTVTIRCTDPGIVCKFVGTTGCGTTRLPPTVQSTLSTDHREWCACPILFTQCKKTLQQNRSQNIMKKQFERQRGTFTGK